MDIKISKIEIKNVDVIYSLGTQVDDFSADGGENIFWPKDTLKRLFESDNDVFFLINFQIRKIREKHIS